MLNYNKKLIENLRNQLKKYLDVRTAHDDKA